MAGRAAEPGPVVGQIHLGRWGKLSWQPFEALIGVLLFQSGLRTLIDPHRRSVPGAPEYFSHFISVIYLLGGVAILLGLWRLWLRVEMGGLGALAIGITTSTWVTFAYQGPDIFWDMTILFAVIGACVARLRQLLRHRVLVQVEVDQ